MFKHISKKLVNLAVQNDIAVKESAEEYIYGLNGFFNMIISIISAVVIGMIINMLFEVVLFIIVYKTLRKYSGGSHSKTALKCYISSCITYLVVLLMIKYYPLSSLMSTAATVLSALVLYILSPVEAQKKPLDDIERKIFRRRSYIYITLYLCIFCIFHYLPELKYGYYCSVIISVSMFIVALFAIEGKIKLARKNHI